MTREQLIDEAVRRATSPDVIRRQLADHLPGGTATAVLDGCFSCAGYVADIRSEFRRIAECERVLALIRDQAAAKAGYLRA